MERLRQVSFLSVGRAVGFSGLGILTIMVALSFQPVLALKSGGLLLLVLLAVLLWKARFPFTNHRYTEAWLLLDKDDRPDERFAGFALKGALREAYLWFARWTAGLASAAWAVALVFELLGIDSGHRA